jgi:cytosine/creatinine deaminase
MALASGVFSERATEALIPPKEQGMNKFLQIAIEEARAGLAAGGIPIGSVLVIEDEIVGRGHNLRVQEGNPVLHAEMACLANAGRLSPSEYRRSILYTTLSPCDMCSGAVLRDKIPVVVVGENRSFQGPEQYLKDRGVQLQVVDSVECYELMQGFVSEHPKLWYEDIGETRADDIGFEELR